MDLTLTNDPRGHTAMIETMFSIPLIRIKCDRWLYKKNKLLDLIPHQDMDIGDETVISNYQGANNLTGSITDILSSELDQVRHQLGSDAQIVRSWFESADNNMFHPPHTHGHGGWSAVLFVDYDPSVHTSTIFVSPFNHFINGLQLQYRPECTEGDLILFPSMLLHYTLPNTSNVRRTVCSFNLTVDMDNLPLSWTPDELDLNQ